MKIKNAKSNIGLKEGESGLMVIIRWLLMMKLNIDPGKNTIGQTADRPDRDPTVTGLAPA